MADHNTIADATWNPVRDNRPAPEVLGQPWHWVKPRRISVSSKSDLFHESVPFEYIAAVFWLMSVTTRHTYQVLTKRPARMLEFFRWVADYDEGCFQDDRIGDVAGENPAIQALGWTPSRGGRGGYGNCGPGWPYENVWLGVSVENQETADERIPLLLQCPAAMRWLSCEPLLGALDLEPLFAANHLHEIDGGPRIDWVVVGGESGPGARPMHPDWARSLRDQCASAGVPYFFKQWGEWRPPLDGESYDTSKGRAQRVPCFIVDRATGCVRCFENDAFEAGQVMRRVGKKSAGRLLDGVEHNAYPEAG